MRRLKTLLKSASIGLVSGSLIGFISGFAFYFVIAVPEAKEMNPMEAASYLCSAGEAPTGLAFLGAIFGPTIGLVFGVIEVNGRRRLGAFQPPEGK